MSRVKDMTGQRFGRLRVLGFDHLDSINSSAYWKCICDCGTEVITRGSCLRTGVTKSCGCLARELSSTRNRTHGCRNTSLYHVWIDMKQRCMNPNQVDYPRWGGRGIKVCDEWVDSFESFKDWAIKNGYVEGLTLDRIHVDGGYSPEN